MREDVQLSAQMPGKRCLTVLSVGVIDTLLLIFRLAFDVKDTIQGA